VRPVFHCGNQRFLNNVLGIVTAPQLQQRQAQEKWPFFCQ
jgi:hypothetical protein